MKCDPAVTSDEEQALPISSSEAAGSESEVKERPIESNESQGVEIAPDTSVRVEVEDKDQAEDCDGLVQNPADHVAPPTSTTGAHSRSGSDSQGYAATANVEVRVTQQPNSPIRQRVGGAESDNEGPVRVLEPDTSGSAPPPSNEAVKEVPTGLVRAATVMAANALLMAVAEIIIEILVLVGLYPKLPFRLDFFFLTILSGLLGLHTVRGMMKDQFDTSINALQVSGLVEMALIAGDTKFMVEQSSKYSAAIPTRTAFAVLTAINLILVVYMALRLLRFHGHRKKLPVL